MKKRTDEGTIHVFMSKNIPTSDDGNTKDPERKKLKGRTLKIVSRAVLALFIIIHGAICFFTTYFGDDYYYAGFVRRGTEYFLSENAVHYTETNGRALVHLLDELLIGFGALPWRLFCIACVGTLVVLLAKLASRSYRADIKEREGDFDCALIATCSLFSVISLPVLIQSVYWMTGALNYIFPITMTVLVYYLFRRDAERGSTHRSYLLVIPAFIAGMTTEQASVCAVLAIACVIVHQLLHRRRIPHPSHFISLVAVLIASATLLLAPGNSARTDYYPEFYALSLLGRIKYNARGLLLAVAGEQGVTVLLGIAIATLAALLLTRAVKRGKGDRTVAGAIKRIFLALLSAVCVIILCLYLSAVVGYAESGADTATVSLSPILILILPIGGVLIASLVRYFVCGETDDLFFLWSAASMQIAMAISPQFGPRTVMISAVMLIVPIAQRVVTHRTSLFTVLLCSASAAIALFATPVLGANGAVLALLPVPPTLILIRLLRGKRAPREGAVRGAAMVAASYAVSVCLLNHFSVACGFALNLPVHHANEAQIERYDGEGELVLYRLRYGAYGYTMPYDNPYHEMMLLRLAGIDEETRITYTDYIEG